MGIEIGNYVLCRVVEGYTVWRRDRKEGDNSYWHFPDEKSAMDWIDEQNKKEQQK